MKTARCIGGPAHGKEFTVDEHTNRLQVAYKLRQCRCVGYAMYQWVGHCWRFLMTFHSNGVPAKCYPLSRLEKLELARRRPKP